ncbi:MAG TPA: hypothetical protein VGR29_13185 [Thermomicrobiales bacterium]|nr:hypothetical protein [Thermomicrobiales bacterium]
MVFLLLLALQLKTVMLPHSHSTPIDGGVNARAAIPELPGDVDRRPFMAVSVPAVDIAD